MSILSSIIFIYIYFSFTYVNAAGSVNKYVESELCEGNKEYFLCEGNKEYFFFYKGI